MYYRSTKRMIVGVTSMLCAATLFLSACQGGDTKETAATASSSDKPQGNNSSAPVTISLFAHAPTDVINLSTNEFTKFAEQKFNMKINWNEAPASDYQAKQSLLLQSGNYPEAFWNGSFTTSDILKYSKQGIIKPISKDMLQKYAPNVWKVLQDDQKLNSIAQAPDGNYYGLPAYNYCQHCDFSSKLWINTNLLKKFNLQMPTTTAEFEHVLEVFKQNGLIPMTGAVKTSGWHSDPTTFLMNSFAYNVDNNNANDYLALKDGKVTYSAITPEWKMGLQYLNGLFKKGLIDPQAFSQKIDNVKQAVAQDKVGVFAQGNSGGVLDGGTQNKDFGAWRTLSPLKGPNGTHFAAFYGNGYGSLQFVITNKAKDEQIIKLLEFINYIYTPEGTETLDFGTEGKYWTKAKPGDKGLCGGQALFNTDSDKFYAGNSRQNEGWDQMGPIYQSQDFRCGFVLAEPAYSPKGLEATLLYETEKNYIGNQPKEVYPNASWIDPNSTQQYALASTNLNKYVQQWTVQFIVGDKSIDQNWDEYVKGIENLGLKDYLDTTQKAMKKPFDSYALYEKPDADIVKFLESSLK